MYKVEIKILNKFDYIIINNIKWFTKQYTVCMHMI